MSQSRWTPEDIEILKEKFPVYGRNIPELQSKYSDSTIKRQAYALGLQVTMKRVLWTPEEDALLLAQYPSKGTNIPELRVKYDAESIKGRARRLGIKIAKDTYSFGWNKEKLDLLREKYPTQGSEIPELLQHHSKKAIASQAMKLGVKRYGNTWPPEDDALIAEKYPTQGYNIPELLPRHTKLAISARAKDLGIRSDSVRNAWTEEEYAILRENYAQLGVNIPELLERHTRQSIQGKAGDLGLTRKSKPWTEEEVALLREHYFTNGTNIPELRVTRSVTDIRNKAQSLGLRVSTDLLNRGAIVGIGAKWSDAEENILREYGPECTVEELAEKLPGRTIIAIQGRMRQLGVLSNIASSVSRSNKNIAAAASAYVGVDDKQYLFVRCAVCGSVLLLPKECAESFVHGTMCVEHAVPGCVALPLKFR